MPTDKRVSHGRRSHDKCHVGLGDSVRNDLRAAARGSWPGCAGVARLLLRYRIAWKIGCYLRLRSRLFTICVCCHLICCRNESLGHVYDVTEMSEMYLEGCGGRRARLDPPSLETGALPIELASPPRGPAAHGVGALQLTLKVMVAVPPAGTFAVWGLALVKAQLAATLEGVSITW